MARLSAGILAFCVLALPVQAATPEEHRQYLFDQCGPTLKMKKSGCECIVAAAKEQLSDKELEMVVMYVKQDKTGIARVQGKLNGNEVMKAVSFVTEAPRACRGK